MSASLYVGTHVPDITVCLTITLLFDISKPTYTCEYNAPLLKNRKRKLSEHEF